MDTKQTLGQAIRAARRNKGLTGEDMRARARIHPTSLSFLELGKREPSLEQLRALARVLDVDPLALAAIALREPRAPRRKRKVLKARDRHDATVSHATR